MRNLALAIALAILPASARAACTPLAGGLSLKLPNFGDAGNVWAQCIRDNFEIINSTTALIAATSSAFNEVAIATTTLGISTTSLQAQVNALSISTQSLRATDVVLAASTTTLSASTESLRVSLASTALATGTLRSDTFAQFLQVANSTNALSASTVSLQGQINVLGISTESLRVNVAALSASTVALSLSTASLGSEVAALSISTAALSLSTAALNAAKVNRSGDTMTGNLTLPRVLASSTTLNGVAYNWPQVDGSATQRLTTDGAGNLSWATVSGGGGGGHVIASGTVSGSTVGVITGQLAQRTTLYFDTTGFELYDDQASSATIIKSKGYQYLTSTTTNPSGSTTSGTLGACFASSTATWTQGNNRAEVCYSGGINNTINANVILGVLVDGQFVGGQSSARGVWQGSVNGVGGANNASGAFCYLLPTLSAGEHSVCLTGATSGGTMTVPAATVSGLENGPAQLSVIELASGGNGISVAASSFTNVPGGDFSNTTLGPCVTGSTVAINSGGGDLEISMVGSAHLQTATQEFAVGFLLDGAFVSPLSATRALQTHNSVSQSDSRNISFNFRVKGVAAGAHNACLTVAAQSASVRVVGTSQSLGYTGAYSGMAQFGIEEIRNAPGTGDVSSNGDNTFSGKNTMLRADISSHSYVSNLTGAYTNTSFGGCTAGSTVTINCYGGKIAVYFEGGQSNTGTGEHRNGFLMDGDTPGPWDETSGNAPSRSYIGNNNHAYDVDFIRWVEAPSGSHNFCFWSFIQNNTANYSAQNRFGVYCDPRK